MARHVSAAMNALQDSKGEIHEVAASQPGRLTPAEWRAAADALRRLQLGEFCAMFLDAAAPVAELGAQFLYVAAPFLGSRALRLAELLESEAARSNLVDYLRSHEQDPQNAAGAARG